MTSPEITDAAGPRPWTVETNLPYGEQPRIYDASGRLVAVVGNAEIDRQDEWEGNAELIVATVNALAAGVAPGVKVRKLDWSEGQNFVADRPWWHATNARPLATYTIERLGKRFWVSIDNSDLRPSFPSLAEAQAHAQADYEARVLSALEPAPSALVAEPGEPVAQLALKEMQDAARYAERLAVALCEKHYRGDAPQWKPRSGDLVGLLTQIDNMTSGLSRAAPPARQDGALREALVDAAAHLRGAASAYREHAARHRSVGRAKPDPFFTTRVGDFEKAADRASATLALSAAPVQQAAPSGEGE